MNDPFVLSDADEHGSQGSKWSMKVFGQHSTHADSANGHDDAVFARLDAAEIRKDDSFRRTIECVVRIG